MSMRKTILLILALLGVPCAFGQYTIPSVTGANAGGSAPTVTFGAKTPSTPCTTTANTTLGCNISVTSGTHEILVCSVSWGNSPSGITVTSMTDYSAASEGGSSQAMTSAGAAATQGSSGIQDFYVVAPYTGSTSVQVVLSTTETHDIFLGCFYATGVNQTTPIQASTYQTTSSSTTSTLSLTITSATGNLVHTSLMNASGNSNSTNQTLIYNETAGTRIGFGTDYAAGASSVTDTWTLTGAPGCAMLGYSLAAG
jgi:hypothetical protein